MIDPNIQLLQQYNVIMPNGKISPNVNKLIANHPELQTAIVKLTEFMPGEFEVTKKQRLFCVSRGITSLPSCVVCGAPTKFQISTYTYSTTCSRACAVLNPSRLEKKRATSLAKYGTINPLANSEVKAKSVATSLAKYGTERPCQSDEIKTKIKQVFDANYEGGHPLRDPSIRSQLFNAHMLKYGASHPQKVPSVYEKTREGCLEKHGVRYPRQVAMDPNTVSKFEDRSWLINQHINLKQSVQHLCVNYNVSPTYVLSKLEQHNIERQYYFQSIAEHEITDWLTQHGINYRTSVRNVISPFELDIVIDHNGSTIAIEYCGVYWHAESDRISPKYHLNKMKMCNAVGVRLITIFEDEWVYNKAIVLNKLTHLLHIPAPKIYARNTHASQISLVQKTSFLNQYHIQGSGRGSMSFGLTHNNVLVAVMTFVISEKELLLNRYATSVTVVGGFSKLLKFATEQLPKLPIVSFADLRWSEGNMYNKAGFRLDSTLPPDYRYVVGNKRIHKFNFRHGTGLQLLPNYDPTLSESQNMENHNIPKIWDCGLLKYIKD